MLWSRVQLQDSVVGLISAQRFDHHGLQQEHSYDEGRGGRNVER